MKPFLLGLFASVMACAMQYAYADNNLYRWVDEQGRIHYGSTSPGKHSTRVLQGAPNPTDEEKNDARTRAQQERQQLTRWESSRPRPTWVAPDSLVHCTRALEIVDFLRTYPELPVVRPLVQGEVTMLDGDERISYLERARARIGELCVSANVVDMADLWTGLFWPRTARGANILPTQFITPPSPEEPNAKFKDSRPATAPNNPTTSVVNAKRPVAPANPATSVIGSNRPTSAANPGAGSFR